MNFEEIAEQMFHAPVRMEAMWPFPVSPASESLIDALENYERLPKALQPLLARWSDDEKAALFEGQSADSDMAFDELCAAGFRARIFGFIGVVATPVMTPTSANSASFSWGHYHTEFLFAETGEKLLIAAIDWANKRHNQDKLAYRAKGGAA